MQQPHGLLRTIPGVLSEQSSSRSASWLISLMALCRATATTYPHTHLITRISSYVITDRRHVVLLVNLVFTRRLSFGF